MVLVSAMIKRMNLIVLCFVLRQLMYKKEFDMSYVEFMRDGAKWLLDNKDIKLVDTICPSLLF